MAGAEPDRSRAALEAEWLDLTRRLLPDMAVRRGWSIRADHCFQRILLDVAVGDVWYTAVTGRPAYRHIAARTLAHAVAIGKGVMTGDRELDLLNRQSLDWRSARKAVQAELVFDAPI